MYEIFDYFREQYEMIMSYVGIEKADNIFDQISNDLTGDKAKVARRQCEGPHGGLVCARCDR